MEHDHEWFAALTKQLPTNIELLFCDESDPNYPLMLPQTAKRFHIVVIDGRHRVTCSQHAREGLTSDGVIVWDNSDRESYQGGLDELVAGGMRRLDLVGLGPVNSYGWTTTILYRDDNCLGL